MEKNKVKIKELLPLIILAALVIAIVALIIVRKDERRDPVSVSYFGCFDTEATFTDYSGLDSSVRSQLFVKLYNELNNYHKLFDIYNEYEGITNIATLNSLAGEGPVSVPRELYELLEYSKEMYTLTGGEVNIAMGAVLRLWHDFREGADSGAHVPTEQELRDAAGHCNISDLVLDPGNMTAELRDPLMSLDVGAVAKGYAVELLADTVTKEGVSGFIINVGGNLRAVGTKPTGDGWLAGIRDPDTFGGISNIREFYIKDVSVVTSGDYIRYVELDGVKYHHIIDKDTLMPANYHTSVSVVVRDSGLADALSTALFSMSYEDGRSLVESIAYDMGISRVVWVGYDGEVLEYIK